MTSQPFTGDVYRSLFNRRCNFSDGSDLSTVTRRVVPTTSRRIDDNIVTNRQPMSMDVRPEGHTLLTEHPVEGRAISDDEEP